MSDTIVASLIATAGIFISVVVSLLISLRQTKIETRKLRDEYLRQYAGKLFEKRIEIYPVLSFTVVDIIHRINLSKVSVTDIKKLAQVLLEWDAHNVIFLSAQPQQVIHRLHFLLADLNKMKDTDLQKVLNDKESLKKIKLPLLDLILALKNDLGIFSIESASTIAGTKAPSSHTEIDQLSGIKEKQYTISNSSSK